MKAAYITHYGQKQLTLGQLPKPSITQPKQVLVRVLKASVNPVDLKIQAGKLRPLLKLPMPLILGNDYVGIVEAIGPAVTNFKVGQKVLGRISKQSIGTFCDYLVDQEANLALLPPNLDLKQAAALPLVGLTAYQALFDKMQAKRGQSILIHAGAGAVGSILVQLAKMQGLTVITTASQRNHAWLTTLGADQVIDYRHSDFTKVCPPVDYVFDTIGKETLLQSFEVVKPGGKVVSVAGLPDAKFAKAYGLNLIWQGLFKLASHKITHASQKADAEYEFLFMRPDGLQLQHLAELVVTGRLQIRVAKEYPFEEIQAACDYVATGHADGKVIIKLTD
ncbi:NADP-dependent oxidoreductase [Ligilactobacillus agilis]|uniref:NADP-dependent oxidoreductase n=1 Tax=Ligilactobacillus agilis TaxID=1601 RepID=UPI0014374D48|nr:NADP-dependent oxidoreductase [Ligilactobacillus agilis]GET18295.1 NADPH:quinone reductase [Ligilactobacillus agilis]